MQYILAGDAAQSFTPAIAHRRFMWFPAGRIGRQEDAHDGWTALLDYCDPVELHAMEAIIRCQVPTQLRFSTPMWQALGGVPASDVVCYVCGQRRTTHEAMSILLVPLPAFGRVTLAHLLMAHCATEHLPDAICGFCKVRGGIRKRLAVSRWSQPLVVSLKWWSWLPNGRGVKPGATVAFQSTWHVEGTITYSFKCIVNHAGPVGHGHYTAFVEDVDSWVLYDDANTHLHLPENSMVIAQPYLLLCEQMPRDAFRQRRFYRIHAQSEENHKV